MNGPDFTKFLEDIGKFAAMAGKDMSKFTAMSGEDYASKGEEVLIRNANKNNIKPGMRDSMPLKRKKGRKTLNYLAL